MRGLIMLCVVFAALTGPAAADQTDPRLDRLFEELRRAPALDAPAIEMEIARIWTDSDSDTIDILMERAAISAEAQDWALVESLMDHAVGLSPSFAEAYVFRGLARLKAGDAGAAGEDFYRAIDLEPRHYGARVALSDLLAGGGEIREAYRMAQEALSWNPHHEGALTRSRRLRRQMDGQEI